MLFRSVCNINELTKRHVYIELLGGTLEIDWNQEDNHVYMTGPAVTVFEGEIKQPSTNGSTNGDVL